jgi:hypothetical protein
MILYIKLMKNRPTMLKNFSEIFFANPQKLSAEFKIWNLGLGLAASAYPTIQCAVELRDADFTMKREKR